MKIKFFLCLVAGLCLMGRGLPAAEDNPVFRSVKYGIFAHHAWGGTDYKLHSPRSNRTEYVWDPGLNDYRKADPGNETDDLWLSGSGMKNSADYPQYFVLPEDTKGRCLMITGTKLEREGRMQFSEAEVYGKK